MTTSAFAVATQSPGHIELTFIASGPHQPTGLSVGAKGYDDNSQEVWSDDKSVDDWVQSNDGWVGRVAFDGPSGLRCFAFVHSDKKQLATASYTSP